MNGVIYARYSSDGQREESIEGQIRECTEYCARNGITVVRHYIDRALSAKTDNRPDFQQMIKDSAKGLFDVIVVWKLDRFARNRYDSAHYKAALKKMAFVCFLQKRTLQMVRKESYWSPCWKAWQNTALRSFRSRSSAAIQKMPSSANITAAHQLLAI